MKLSLQLIFLALGFTNLISLASAEQLKLKSDPADAKVFIRDLGGIQNIKIGNTPYEGNILDLATNYAKSNFFLVVIEKDGYESQSILLSDLLKSDIELNINLSPKEDILYFRKLDKSMNDMMEAQRLLRAQQYDEAISLLKNVETDQPKLSIVPELIGSAFYLKKDQRNSLTWFEKAYRMNPENKDAYTMKSYLRKALGTVDGK
jgi:tetratricopeptide (TPR) repeat protein